MIPLLLGSDKTLASNATGQNEFHPLYLSLGNVKNAVRRAHRDAVVPIGFLAIPKSMLPLWHVRIPSHRISRLTERRNEHIVPFFPTTTTTSIAKGNSKPLAAIHDKARYCDVSRRPLSKGCIHTRTLHCGLSRASTTRCCCQWVVSRVSEFLNYRSPADLRK